MPPCKWKVTGRMMLQAWLQVASDTMRHAGTTHDPQTLNQMSRVQSIALARIPRFTPAVASAPKSAAPTTATAGKTKEPPAG